MNTQSCKTIELDWVFTNKMKINMWVIEGQKHYFPNNETRLLSLQYCYVSEFIIFQKIVSLVMRMPDIVIWVLKEWRLTINNKNSMCISSWKTDIQLVREFITVYGIWMFIKGNMIGLCPHSDQSIQPSHILFIQDSF